ncbi:hypothetical protein BDQ17DRAFT_1396897 [Cyathus striatus]|nr:hypothetical protein BDQ17DRAFT_1396897 [Cyathus striatus]
MSEDTPTTTPAPRRSQREKKAPKQFTSVASTSTRKRKRPPTSDTENEQPQPDQREDVQGDEADAENDSDADEEEYESPKTKPTPRRKDKAKSTPKSKDTPATKKPRATKPTGPKPVKTAARRGRKPKEGANAYDADQVAKDTKIAADNPLFNAIMNPIAALQSTAEDFLESLEQTPGAAQAELINLILRACGCNDSVNADEALDYDGVVDALDNFTEVLKQENTPTYPLTSKLLIFKKFRKSLSEFIERLIASSADLGILYTSDLMPTLQTWVIAMSSSQIRSFRHTATVVALEVETALCDVAAAVEKEAEVVGRQREGERKRKGATKGGNARVKELEVKAQEIRDRRSKLAEFLKEFVDGVFVHRYRDLDPNIRAECVHAIGLWFRKYPGHFLEESYLRYVGWVLSDSNTHVRLEAVRALSGVYEQANYIGSFNHFTERFKPRLLEIATSDTELSVRVAVIQVLGAIDHHSLLEEEEREKLCLLVFDEETKVRKAVSQFVRGVWEEAVDERLVGRNKVRQKAKDRVGLKALAALLVQWGKSLDDLIGENDSSENGDTDAEDTEEGARDARPSTRRKEVLALAGTGQKGRVALAVEALWDEVEPVRDWEELLEILLLDHSASDGRGDDSIVDEVWRLEEVEEAVLLEVFVATLRRAKADAASAAAKKGQEENISNDITRALITALPRLFIKHQTYQNRISEVLLIPTLMNLDLYLEMRMIASYASLWDDVTKQFLSHSSVTVLSRAMSAIRYFMDATSLSNTNSTKILELEDELSSALRDAVAGRDEIEVATFSEDEVLVLGALCTRLATLTGSRNMTIWMEEDEGGKQSSAWDIIVALAERGRLGYREEETMVEQALNVLRLHVLWKAKGLSVENDSSPEDIRFREVLVEQRDTLLEKLIEYAVGTQSNTVEGVRRAAFKYLLDLHVLFCASERLTADGRQLPTATIALSMADELQYRCAGYIQAEIERYAELTGENADPKPNDENSDDDGSSDGEQPSKEQEKVLKARKGRKQSEDVDETSISRLEHEYLFIDVISTFLRAIRAGVVNVQHGAVLLAHYGRLGLAFDMCSKLLNDILREEGMEKNNGDVVVTVLTKALSEAYTLVLEGVVDDESNSVQLAKTLSGCFVVRGSQLSILRRLESRYIVQVHSNLLTWIGKRLASYQSNNNKKGLKLGALFFRALTPLVSIVGSRDALKIKAHMDQVIAQAKIDIPPTSKVWEPQRAYEKRLGTAIAKDNAATKVTTDKKKGKGVAGAVTDEEIEGDEIGEGSEPEEIVTTPRRAKRAQNDAEATDQEEQLAEPITPKVRRHTPPATSTSPVSPVGIREDSPLTNPESLTASENMDVSLTSRKRPRNEDDDDMVIPNGTVDNGDANDGPATPVADDIHVRRKRIRH